MQSLFCVSAIRKKLLQVCFTRPGTLSVLFQIFFEHENNKQNLQFTFHLLHLSDQIIRNEKTWLGKKKTKPTSVHVILSVRVMSSVSLIKLIMSLKLYK